MNTAYKKLPGYIFLAAAFVGVAGSSFAFALGNAHSPGTQPPFGLFLAMGIGIIALTALILALAVRMGLPLKSSTIGLIFAFNALIVLVKFVVAPLGLYATNLSNNGFLNTSALVSSGGYWQIAISVFVLYALVLAGLFRLAGSKNASSQSKHRHPIWVVAGIIAVLAILLYAGWLYVLLPLILLAFPLIDYLSSTGGLFIVILGLLMAAIFIAALAVRSASGQAKLLRDGSMLASLFWLCLSIILLYHVLWVVFMTALITVWPFKTFVPGGK